MKYEIVENELLALKVKIELLMEKYNQEFKWFYDEGLLHEAFIRKDFVDALYLILKGDKNEQR